MAYEKLFEAGKIGSMTIKNRGVMVPMATDMADKDGLPTGRQIRYYQERAKGGIGMIINEYTGVDDIDSIPTLHNLRAARDYQISALEELTDAVHLYGCRIVAQLHHGGATSNPAFTGRDSLAPSAIAIADGRPVPKEMTLEDIKRIEDKFIAAAVRCKKAGYDAVELHGAHGYLIAQFFSKYYNRRTDEYGGSVENRCRFLAEIIAGIRKELGPKFPILVRMCGDEMTPVEGFLSLEEGLEIAKYLESLGIDAINISNGSARNGDANCEPFSYQPGWKKHVAKAYKEALSIPVIATNTIKDPDFAESLLEEGVCDFVGLGRSQLADPDFMNKARAGVPEQIRKCIGCLYCRERVLGGGLPIRCAVNPRTAREIDFPEVPGGAVLPGGSNQPGSSNQPGGSNQPGIQTPCGGSADSGNAGGGFSVPCGSALYGSGKPVAVIGGGPAGMQAAITLAQRGYRPVLFEKENTLGGTLNIADKPPLKDKITRMCDSMQAQLAALGVEVRLGEAATPETVKAVLPDACGVIVTCGASAMIPPIEGLQGGLASGLVMTAEDVLTGKASVPAGAQAAVIGSGLTGLETAESLLAAGCKLSVIEMLPALGPGVFPAILNDEMSRITPYEPGLYPGHKVLAVKSAASGTPAAPAGTASQSAPAGTVTVEETATGNTFDIPADAIVLAAGVTPRTETVRAFEEAFDNVLVAGDAREGGRIATATRQGFEAAYTFRG